MKETIKKALKFALILLPFAAVGGYFTGKYAFASYTEDVQQMILEQIGSVEMLALVSMVQSAMYAVFCTVVGYIVAEKTGLMKPLNYEKDKLIKAGLLAAGCGIFFSLDYWVFGSVIPEVAASYESEILIRSVDNWIASVLYGGIVEELMLRLFMMSLVTLILWKLFGRKYSKEEIPNAVYMSANIICALLFAAGHLPATISMFGGLSALILIRCFLLNGVFGIVFGWLYQKYGIQYAFVGHAGTHIVSKLIWLVFV